MKSILSLLLSLVTFIAISQSTVNNLDFEDGNFNNWTTINGTVSTAPPGTPHPFSFSSFGILNASNYSNASHLLIDSQQYDPDISFIKTLCPFTNSNSVRLGDNNGGGEASRIEKVITVNSTNTKLDFFFALVMQDPAHPLHEQPYIFIELYDSTAGALTLIDSIFVVGGTSALTLDTTSFGAWKYIDWNHQQFNLSAFVGRKVLLRITNGDCGYGAHSGRLYLDFSLDASRKFSSSFLCSATDSIVFRGNSFDSVGVYSDTVWSGSIVDSVFTLIIKGGIQTPISAKLANYNLCLSSTVFDMDCNVAGGTPGTLKYTWMVDGVPHQSGLNPHLTYATTTNDTIFCVVTQMEGSCFVLYSDTLIVGPSVSSPMVSLTIFGTDVKSNITGGKAPYSYSWKVNFSNLPYTNDSITPGVNGTYYVFVTDANGCETKDSIYCYNLALLENEGLSNLSFYPNPSSDFIKVDLQDESGMLRLLDAQGKLITEVQVKNKIQKIDVSSLERGVYLLYFKSENGNIKTGKLILE